MDIKFISELGIIDLSHVYGLSVEENNSRVSDSMFTFFTLPFTFYATSEFLTTYGDYTSYETVNKRNKITGNFIFENKSYEATLYIKSIQGQKITAQIDFGFEELPNFKKKLSELPLEHFTVPDIHVWAKETCAKTYPFTNYNFPRIYTEKYESPSLPWNNFDGYYNDLKPDGSEMRRNYIDGAGNIFNVNIIHPCPHILYLLKTGFEDAGYTLAGDILNEPLLQNKWVFSETEYFTSLQQLRHGFLINEYDYVSLEYFIGFKRVIYSQSKIIENIGNYKLIGSFWYLRLNNHGSFRVYLNNILIYNVAEGIGYANTFNFDFMVTTPNSELKVEIRSHMGADVINVPVLQCDLIGDALQEIQDTGNTDVITNLNEINLKKAVPDITFGDLVSIICRWFNYDIEIKDKNIIMNRIVRQELDNVVDFTFLEVPEPKQNLLNKRSFLIKFPDVEGTYKKNSMFYDVNGPTINGEENSETTIIEIKGLQLPLKLPKPGGYNTAYVVKDASDLLMLVEYNGTVNGQNNATYTPGCEFPELLEYHEDFLRQRINATEFNWVKDCPIAKIQQFKIKQYIKAFNNIHIVKNLSKTIIDDETYEVEITTETVV